MNNYIYIYTHIQREREILCNSDWLFKNKTNKKENGQPPPLDLLAGADRRVEGHCVWPETAGPHIVKEVERPFPLEALLAGADGRVAGDDVWRQLALTHLLRRGASIYYQQNLDE